MIDLAKDYSILAAVGLFILDKLWTMFDRSVHSHEKALESNTLALTRLETTIKYLEQRITKLEGNK